MIVVAVSPPRLVELISRVTSRRRWRETGLTDRSVGGHLRVRRACLPRCNAAASLPPTRGGRHGRFYGEWRSIWLFPPPSAVFYGAIIPRRVPMHRTAVLLVAVADGAAD